MALPGFSRFEVQGSRFKVRCLPYLSRMQFASRASLGVVWGHSGHTLDMSYTHRTRSNPRFRAARLIQVAPSAATLAAFCPHRPCYAGGSPVIPRRVPDVDHEIPFICRAFMAFLGFFAVFGRIGMAAPEAHQPFPISLTPNFSWVWVELEESQPLQRFSTASAPTGQVEKTVETVGGGAGPHPPH
jgi:hypothetical protein